MFDGDSGGESVNQEMTDEQDKAPVIFHPDDFKHRFTAEAQRQAAFICNAKFAQWYQDHHVPLVDTVREVRADVSNVKTSIEITALGDEYRTKRITALEQRCERYELLLRESRGIFKELERPSRPTFSVDEAEEIGERIDAALSEKGER